MAPIRLHKTTSTPTGNSGGFEIMPFNYKALSVLLEGTFMEWNPWDIKSCSLLI